MGWENVQDHGAVGDGQTDDTQAFNDAIDALGGPGIVYGPPGRYMLQPSQGPGLDAAIKLGAAESGVRFVGAGRGATSFAAMPGSYVGATNLFMIEEGEDIGFAHLALDGNLGAATYADEQSHGIDVRVGARISFEDVLFTDFHGDGARLLGMVGESNWVDGVLFDRCRFFSPGRSGIGVQRGVKRVRIDRCWFRGHSDQEIDFEPTGGSATEDRAPRDFDIVDNIFHGHGAIAVTLTGFGDFPARGLRFERNKVVNGQMFLYNVAESVVRDNSVDCPAGIVFDMKKTCRKVLVAENEFETRGGSGEGAVRLGWHTSAAPEEITIADNLIRSGPLRGIYTRDGRRIRILGNEIVGTANEGVRSEIIMQQLITHDDFHIAYNRISGYATGVRLNVRTGVTDQYADVLVEQNEFYDVTTEVVLP